MQLINKWDVVSKLIDLENEFQQYKPFRGFEHAMYRKICKLEIAIGKASGVDLVQCKDCKHYRNHPNGMCYAWTEPYDNEQGYKGDVHCVEPDDFCSFGERKDNAED